MELALNLGFLCSSSYQLMLKLLQQNVDHNQQSRHKLMALTLTGTPFQPNIRDAQPYRKADMHGGHMTGRQHAPRQGEHHTWVK